MATYNLFIIIECGAKINADSLEQAEEIALDRAENIDPDFTLETIEVRQNPRSRFYVRDYRSRAGQKKLTNQRAKPQ